MKVKHLLYVVNLLIKLIVRAGAKAQKKASDLSVQMENLRRAQNVLDTESLHAARVASKLKAIVE